MMLSPQKVDVLVFAAHPDDAELSCAGTIIKHVKLGYRVAIVDLTRGEMGTRGTPELRLQESDAASKILGIHHRENLGLRDVFFNVDEHNAIEVVKSIRKYQPDVILANAIDDRHPDHGKAAELVEKAWFWAGLRKIETGQAPWRSRRVLHYIQDRYLQPDLIIDITEDWPKVMLAIKAFKSQFFDPNSSEPSTYISSPDFLNFIESRAREFGRMIGTGYGDGFTLNSTPGIQELNQLL